MNNVKKTIYIDNNVSIRVFTCRPNNFHLQHRMAGIPGPQTPWPSQVLSMVLGDGPRWS